jgi:benzylsuccinate CoA-transferase BbsF subunit
MEQWGFGYEQLKKIKPEIIMVRSSNQGQTGPHFKRRGFGILLASLVGYNSLVGWPDRGPTSMYIGYTDFLAPRLAATTILAALDHRDRTGEGILLDVSQFEVSLQFLAPVVLDYMVHQREPERKGNACDYAAPHGVYRCKGEDRWVAISVFTDTEWEAFCGAIGNPDWTKEGRFQTLLDRKENEAELNDLIEKWTILFYPEEVMLRLQSVGIAAGVVESTKDAFEDVQMRSRNHLWPIEHPEIGLFHHLGQSVQMSETPAVPRRPAPCLGEHTEYVCRELLGMSDERFVELMAKGIFY